MPRKKKQGVGGLVGVAVMGLLVLIAAVPREVWIGLGAIAAAVFAINLFLKSKSTTAQRLVIPEPQPQPQPQPGPGPEAVPQPAMSRSVPAGPTPQESVQASPDFRSSARANADAEVPVLVHVEQVPAPMAKRVPPAPSGFGKAKWIPVGEPVTVAGVTIPGGMVYIGTTLNAASGGADPSLIDPSKSVASRGDYTERLTG